MSFQSLVIGVPTEIFNGERRVAAMPETIKKFIEDNVRVLVETGAGEGSYYSDDAYRAAGAELVDDVEELYRRCDLIIKVKEPRFNSAKGKHETEMMREGQHLIAFLHPAFPGNHDMVKSLAKKGIISLTLDSIPRISRSQSMDALTSMSIVAGYKGLLMAANRLGELMPVIATALGVIPPAEVFVIGTGVAGLQAITTAKSLGAVVHGSDIRREACDQAVSVGAKLVDVNIPQELAVGEGGYARTLPDKWLVKEREALRKYVPRMDIIVLSALIPGKLAPVLITEEMVKSMKPGSVIVDISIDQGGNCEISDPGKVVEKHEVVIIGIQNIPGTVARCSTRMFAGNMYNFVHNLIRRGALRLDLNDEIVKKCLVTMNGEIVHSGAREAIKLQKNAVD